MNKHAFLSASGAPAWTLCEVKPWRELGLPDETSDAAAEGTKAHKLLEDKLKGTSTLDATPEMREDIEKTEEIIRLHADGGQLYSEQRLDISGITGEEGAKGTADVIIVKPTEIIIIDLKYGFVKVDAVDNAQLLIYGAAALENYDVVGEVKTITMIISQPRMDRTSTWSLSVDEVVERINSIREIGERILAAKGGDHNLRATPGEKQCMFCKVSATCPENRGQQLAAVTNDFVDLDKPQDIITKVQTAVDKISFNDDNYLATCMSAVDNIENWCKAVRAEVYKRLVNDSFSDNRYKLVQGREGHRKLSLEESELIEIANDHGIPTSDIFEAKTKSVAQLEKAYKKGNPVFWAKVAPYIVRPEGLPTVVEQSDARPALNVALDFKVLEESEFVDALIGLKPEE